MNNLELYKGVFMNIFNIKESELNENFNACQVERWDSVNQMALVGEIEDAFGIMLEIEDIVEFTSYEKGKDILKKYQVEV